MNGQVGNVQLMQKINRLKVLNCIRQSPYTVRPSIAEKTGLSLASITNIVSFLIEKGLVTEKGLENVERIGRKAVLLKFCNSSYNLVCVNISQDRITISLTDLDGNILKSISENISAMTSQRALDFIKKNIKELVSDENSDKVLGIGVALSAFVLPDGTVEISSKLRWDRFDIKSMLEKETDKPIFIMDTSAAGAYYCNGKNKDIKSMLYIDLFDGVGAVNFYDGVLNKTVSGEIGHTTVEKDGDECFCGNRGCLEAMCSLERVAEQYKKSGKGISIEDAVSGYQKGEKTATELFKKTGEYLGIGIANAINLFSPNKVLINAGQYEKCKFVLEIAIDEARKRAFSALFFKTEFETIKIDEAMTVKGMSQYLCESIFNVDFHGELFD